MQLRPKLMAHLPEPRNQPCGGRKAGIPHGPNESPTCSLTGKGRPLECAAYIRRTIMATNSDLLARRNKAVPRGVAHATPVYADRAENGELWDVEGKRY